MSIAVTKQQDSIKTQRSNNTLVLREHRRVFSAVMRIRWRLSLAFILLQSLQWFPRGLAARVLTDTEDDGGAQGRLPWLNVSDLDALEVPGVAVDVPYRSALQELFTFPERRPFMTNLLVATVKTSFADVVVQVSLKVGASKVFDLRRTVVFALFGFLYIGVVEWLIYVRFFTWMCPHAVAFANEPWDLKLDDSFGQMDLAKQILFDNLVHYTCIYYPVFYTLKGLIQGGRVSVVEGLQQYAQHFTEDNLLVWAIWLPGDVIVFSVPMWLRMLVNHGISFMWTMMLSYLRGDLENK